MLRFRTAESLLLLVAALALISGAGYLLSLGPGWIAGLCAAFVLFAFFPLAARMQDFLLEHYLATGRFTRALKLASAIRDSARTPLGRGLAEFDVALVHLARGAPADALRSFGRIEKHRLQQRTRVLVDLYAALARLRSTPEDGRAPAAEALLSTAKEAAGEFGEDPHVLAMEAEAHLARGEAEDARRLLTRSLDLDGDPHDPSPGERYVLFARASRAVGAEDAARRALEIAARLRARGPFVTAAREELAQLEPRG